LNFKIDQGPQVTDFPRLGSLADSHKLSSYDTAYLDLAIRLALPLATRDDDLRKAAEAEGVRVL
jgi:predicted nucleic acid-binding protein